MSGLQTLTAWAGTLLLGLPLPLGVAPPAPAASEAPSPAAVPAPSWLGVTLDLTVDGGGRRLSGSAELRLAAGPGGMRAVHLHPGLTPQRLSLEGRPVAWRRDGEWLRFALPALGAPATLRVTYRGRPLTQAAGALLQDVEPRLAMMRPAGGWWPRPEGNPPPISLTVHLPEGWRALSLGSRLSFAREGRTARLQCPAGEPLAWVAGPFEPFRRADVPGWGPTRTPQAVSEGFLKAMRARGLWPADVPTWIDLPEGFAPASCPDAFAAPLPPGGAEAALAALCFAPRTAELGIQPERAWLVEALGAYMARQGGAAGPSAQVARRSEARYAAYLARGGTQDRPLSEAFGLTGEAWQAVVGDKGGIAWGLVRSALGEEAFWALLRAWRVECRAGRGTWADLLRLSPQPMAWLSAWLAEPGLPTVRFESVRVEPQASGWRVSGVLAHRAGLLGVPTDLVLIKAEGTERIAFRTFAPRIPFAFEVASRPLRLVLDARDEAPLRRRPHARVVDALRAPGAVIVHGTGGDVASIKAMREAAERLARRLAPGAASPPVVRSDTEVTEAERRGPLILIGRPGLNACVAPWADQLPVRFTSPNPGDSDGRMLWWQGRTWTRIDAGVVAAIANPLAPDHSVLLVAGLSPQAHLEALRFVEREQTFCIFGDAGPLEEGLALRTFPDLELPLY